MKFKNEITYVLLERGTEDKALWQELTRIIVDLKLQNIKDFIKNIHCLIN